MATDEQLAALDRIIANPIKHAKDVKYIAEILKEQHVPRAKTKAKKQKADSDK